MDETILAEFKELLQKQMDDLLQNAGETVSEMTEEKTNFTILDRGDPEVYETALQEALPVLYRSYAP